MTFGITLAKMATYFTPQLQYMLKADEDFIKMNDVVGQKVKLEFLNQKFCSGCGNEKKELFRMGFCKNCFFTNPRAGESIIRPELSRAHLGETDRDLEYEKSYQLQPHIVYLANSAGLKVGVTRGVQQNHRWADQGASHALVFAKTTNRYEAGEIEVALKEYVSDKTPWQRMLKNEVPEVDLVSEKENLQEHLPAEWRQFVTKDEAITSLEYPVIEYPAKVKSINLDKNPVLKGTLKGVKGQYLIFEEGRVFNVRSHTGYRVSFSLA